MIKALRNDFKYMVSYDCDTVYSCSESGCYDEGICRCGYITNTYLNRVDVSAIVTNIYSIIFDNSISTKRNNAINSLWGISEEIEKYTIDRILRVNKIWKPELWNISVSGGYYGQEVDEIVLVEEVVQKINSELETAFEIESLTERIEYLLKLENGYILEDIKNSEYHLKLINLDDISFLNKSHLKRIKLKPIYDLDYYSDRSYHGIRGIVKKDGDKWKVIDGYHRLSKTENKTVKVLAIF